VPVADDAALADRDSLDTSCGVLTPTCDGEGIRNGGGFIFGVAPDVRVRVVFEVVEAGGVRLTPVPDTGVCVEALAELTRAANFFVLGDAVVAVVFVCFTSELSFRSARVGRVLDAGCKCFNNELCLDTPVCLS